MCFKQIPQAQLPIGNHTNFFVSFPGNCPKYNHNMLMMSIDIDVLENQWNLNNNVPSEYDYYDSSLLLEYYYYY